MNRFKNYCRFIWIIMLLSLSSCASPPLLPLEDHSLAYYVPEKNDLLHRHVPIFIIEEPEQDYNRIGTVIATNTDKELVTVNPDRATVYGTIRSFTTSRSNYTNLLYRIHFQGVPASHLGYGENMGLLIVVTLNKKEQPLLYTLVHTCGCYLSFIPTSYLPRNQWADNWPQGRQEVYSENLPASLQSPESKTELAILIRSATHRVRDVWLANSVSLQMFTRVEANLKSFESLEKLALPDGGTTSFFETSGPRIGYVKGSEKIWERLFISWWAFDWRVGEDKKLGKDLSDGTFFYTSLKPWAREESDLRNFTGFLNYWGWKL